MRVSDADVSESDMVAAGIEVRLAEGDAAVHGDGDADVDLEMMIVAVCVLDGAGADDNPVRVPVLELGNEEDEGKIVETYRRRLFNICLRINGRCI